MRPLEAIIDTQALIYNLNRARAYSSHSKVMSVLKANAYGHGLIEVARALNQSEGFSVLSLTEAIELREFGFNQEILMLEGFFDKYETKPQKSQDNNLFSSSMLASFSLHNTL